jgi:hypothetical protein
MLIHSMFSCGMLVHGMLFNGMFFNGMLLHGMLVNGMLINGKLGNTTKTCARDISLETLSLCIIAPNTITM